METQFVKLNDGWNADPNSPDNSFSVEGDTFWLRFKPNRFKFETERAEGPMFLRFCGCQKFRFTSVNDHGFYLGQCRFTQIAPAWGEFYEVVGDFREDENPTVWQEVGCASEDSRNFLFYTRDETFEVIAEKWERRWDAPALDFKWSTEFPRVLASSSPRKV
ncbi:MAG: hypothetical protein ACU0GG_07170 [Paracoccaceae bacterium]